MSPEFERARQACEEYNRYLKESAERKRRLEERERVLKNYQRTVRELAESVERMKAGMN
jgi:hypothetical protein